MLACGTDLDSDIVLFFISIFFFIIVNLEGWSSKGVPELPTLPANERLRYISVLAIAALRVFFFPHIFRAYH